MFESIDSPVRPNWKLRMVGTVLAVTFISVFGLGFANDADAPPVLQGNPSSVVP